LKSSSRRPVYFISDSLYKIRNNSENDFKVPSRRIRSIAAYC
jgi:hypothetical protein